MWFLFAVLLSSPVGASSGNDHFQPLQLAVRPGDSLKIAGVHGRLRLIRDTKYRNMHFQMNQRHRKASADWNLVVERRGSSIEIEVFSAANVTQWKSELSKAEWPDYDITIRGPSLPVSASWREGSIEIVQWNQPMDLVLLDGELNVQNSSGSLVAQGANLNFTATQYDGDMRFTADKGQVVVSKSKGKMAIQMMEGAMKLTDFQGDFTWNSERAALVSTGGGGKWNLQSTRGPVTVENFKGIMKGVGDKALWKLNVADTSEVEIQSQSGPVRVRWNKGAAKAFLSSKSGVIKAPVIAKVRREEGVNRWLAQWGQGRLGQLFVNTQSGSINLNK